MPLTVFDIKGVSYTRIEQAVVAAGKHMRQPYEGWIATDPRSGGVRVTITGANGFQRQVAFAADEELATIMAMVRATLGGVRCRPTLRHTARRYEQL